MHSLRRAALRAGLSASRAVSNKAQIVSYAARAANFPRTGSPQVVRLFSQTVRRASENKELEEAQRKAEEDFSKQIVEDARQDVEESIAQTEADIQEAMQEVTAEERPAQNSRSVRHSAFIRNLVFEITEDNLKVAFSKFGPVESAYIARDPRGLSKGYGFIEFQTAEALQKACSTVNGSFWHGRRITCIPRAVEGESSGQGQRKKMRKSPAEPTRQLFVGNIPYETTDAELNRLFRGIENLKDVRVAVDRTTGWPRGFAHIDFATVEAAVAAKKRLEGAVLGERPLRIDFAEGYVRQRGATRRQESNGEVKE